MSQAYSYCRFSHARQQFGDSLRRQIEQAAAYCDRLGLNMSDHSYRDLGLSGFHGRHLKEKGALAAFLKAVESGVIPSGSHIVCENLDRLSRLEPVDGLDLIIKQLLKAGITIHTTQDSQIYKPGDERSIEKLIVILMHLQRAHSESRFKSERIKESWTQKWKQAEKGGILCGKTPGWIDIVNGEYKINAAAKKTIRRIVDLGLKGHGPTYIAKLLNDEKVPTLAKRKVENKKRWDISLVKHYMTSQTLIGLHQPTTLKDGKRIPMGDPMQIYPPVIDDETYWKLQATFKKRAIGRVSTKKNIGNVFGDLCRAYPDGSAIRVGSKRANEKYMRSANSMLGLTDDPTFSYLVFEKVLLKWIAENLSVSYFNSVQKDDTADISARLDVIRLQIAELNEVMDESTGSLKMLAKRLAKLEAEQDELQTELNKKQATGTVIAANAYERIHNLYRQDDYESRTELRQALTQCIKEIHIRFCPVSKLHRRIAVAVVLPDSVQLLQIDKERNKQPVMIWANYQSEKTFSVDDLGDDSIFDDAAYIDGMYSDESRGIKSWK